MTDSALIIAVVAVAVGVVIASIGPTIPGSNLIPADGPDEGFNLADEATDQTTSIFEDVAVALTPSTYSMGNLDQGIAITNTGAFLDMIAFAEGTAGPDGYRTMFGHRLFDSFADHPRQLFSFTNSRGETLKTSAAGRYQFLVKTWDGLRAKLNLHDFSPASQDAGAIELIRERGALNDVRAGRIADAVRKCAPVWASLPGAGYAQPERKLNDLIAAYGNAGGQVTA